MLVFEVDPGVCGYSGCLLEVFLLLGAFPVFWSLRRGVCAYSGCCWSADARAVLVSFPFLRTSFPKTDTHRHTHFNFQGRVLIIRVQLMSLEYN